jgi:hypothetical protein
VKIAQKELKAIKILRFLRICAKKFAPAKSLISAKNCLKNATQTTN